MSENSNKKSFPLKQYNASIQRLLKEQVPKVWVRAEIAQLQVRGNMVYITFAEHEEGVEKPTATLSAYCWSSDYHKFQAEFQTVSAEMELREDLKVCVLLEADFYVPYGKLQARVVAIDPVFSLGELARLRTEIRKRLQKEGLLQRQKELEISLAPLSIGLITAPGSAAHNDFVSTLLKSRYNLDIHLKEARMQGQATATDISKAIGEFKVAEVDLICIIRGGGSKTDLVWFDSEDLCRAIAHSPIPILTGIGHEIDHSLADEVSAIQGITPTASAEWILAKLEKQWNTLLQYREFCRSEMVRDLQYAKDGLKHVGIGISNSTKMQLEYAQKKISKQKKDLDRLSFKILNQSESDSLRLVKQLERTANRIAFESQSEWVKKQIQISKQSKKRLAAEAEIFKINAHGFDRGVDKLIKFEEQILIHRKTLIAKSMLEMTRRATDTVQNMFKQVKALDPKGNLKRGYTIVRSADTGKVVKFGELAPHSEIETEFDGGLIHSKVIRTEKRKSNG